VTAPAKAPTRRVLSRKTTHLEATLSADWWDREGQATGVRVEEGHPAATDTQPFVVTADKRSTGGGSP